MQEIQEILDKLKDNNWWVRKNTIENLIAYPEDSYLSILEEWLRNGDDALLRNADMEAFRTPGERAVGSLISLLKDKDPDVRIFSANVLVDSVSHVIKVASDSVEAAPEEVLEIDADYITGVCKIQNSLAILIDLEKLLKREKIEIKEVGMDLSATHEQRGGSDGKET